METARQLFDFARQHAGTVGLLATWAGIAWVYLRKRADWRRKQFLSQVNFSLSYVADGKLAMRTLLETAAHEVWLNDLGVKQVLKAAGRTTEDNPFITLPDEKDQAFVYRAVLNVLSEKFADAYLAQSAGLPVQFHTYRFAVTCERFADIRTLKIRVVLARDEDLKETFAEGRPVDVPSKYYLPRLELLRAMSKLFVRDGQPDVMPLGRVVLGLRV